ncbi:MAG: restriction endonuclease subunit S [Nostoc sp. CmiVER01]|uniref:restriction endonuclease subunit S n=1 Tax=Nostoc sp. CmiVER01 TaxID=3075384 RepID=UPI002AD2F184|nr:restriction endonuclease subunit S [Nostoc sp. CmiVER01]MDZ8126634.1 restriction endonuclease subunit S [Nostoc sp. CmiVER01]
MAFPKYETYKYSGVEWLGEIPSHWDLQNIRAVTELKCERNRPDLPVLSVYREYGVLLKDSRDDNHNATGLDISSYKVVEIGDLVINKMKAWQGSMGISDYQGIVSPAYIICRVKSEKIEPKFLHYLVRSKPYIGVYNALSYGVRVRQWDMHYEDLKKIGIPLPTSEEQQRIVAFLERTTAEIDEAIAKKQRLIKLLQEQKAILINQAVTKGLNPKASMRDSGVEWFGEIPEHWATAKIKHIAKFYSGGTPSKEKSEFWDGDIPWVSPKDMKFRYIKDTEDKITQKALKKTTIKLLDTNAVLIVVRGMILARKIPVALTCFSVTINQDMKALVLNVHCLPEYLVFLIEGVNKNLSTLLEESGHGTKTLPTEKLGAFVVPIPPKDEQVNIINFIKENDAQTDSSIATINKQILLLEEFRCNIIASAVTGKMKM